MTRHRKSVMRLESVSYQDITKISGVLTIGLHASVSTVQSNYTRHNLPRSLLAEIFV